MNWSVDMKIPDSKKSLAALLIFGLSTLVSSPALAYGLIKICVASDFDWKSRASVDLPPRTIFEFGGKVCGDLYQPTEVKPGSPLYKCYNDGKDDADEHAYDRGDIMTVEAAVLTERHPCTTAHARMYVSMPDAPLSARASTHQGWIAWRVFGFSVWHDDFGTPEGQPNSLGPIFDNFQIRAQILSPVGDPFVVTPKESVQLQDQIDSWNEREKAEGRTGDRSR